MKITFLAIAFTSCAASASFAQLYPAFKDIEPADRAITRRAYDVFVKRCPGLVELAPLIEAITVRDEEFTLTEGARSRDWTIAVSVEVHFRDSSTRMAYDLGVALMNDYLFLLGSGKDSGILSMATTGLRLCEAQYPSDFMPIKELTFLTKWPSDAVPDKESPHQRRRP